jgi:hypothetical protein
MKASEIEIGQRVVVQIAEPKEYAIGCAESLDGKTGKVESRSKDGERWLVGFDTPAEGWSTNQLKSIGFWFEPKDLAKEIERSVRSPEIALLNFVTLTPPALAANPWYGRGGLLVGRVDRDLGEGWVEVFWGTHVTIQQRGPDLASAPDGAQLGKRVQP